MCLYLISVHAAQRMNPHDSGESITYSCSAKYQKCQGKNNWPRPVMTFMLLCLFRWLNKKNMFNHHETYRHMCEGLRIAVSSGVLHIISHIHTIYSASSFKPVVANPSISIYQSISQSSLSISKLSGLRSAVCWLSVFQTCCVSTTGGGAAGLSPAFPSRTSWFMY